MLKIYVTSHGSDIVLTSLLTNMVCHWPLGLCTRLENGEQPEHIYFTDDELTCIKSCVACMVLLVRTALVMCVLVRGDIDWFYSKKCFFLMCKMKGWWLVLFREVVALNFDSLCTTGEDGNWDVKFPQKWLIHSSTILHTYFIVFFISYTVHDQF